MSRSAIASLLIVVAGCATGFTDERGNYFHSRAEQAAWYRDHPTLETRVLGRPVSAVIDMWGLPTRQQLIDGREVYEWESFGDLHSFGVASGWRNAAVGGARARQDHCRKWVTLGPDSMVISVNHEGQCGHL